MTEDRSSPKESVDGKVAQAKEVERLYRDTERWVRAQLSRFGAGTQEAADLAQQVFVKLLRAKKPLHEIRSITGYLAVVAASVLFDAYAQRRQRMHVIVDSPLSEREGDEIRNAYADGYEALVASQEIERIAGQFPESERAVLWLKLAGFSARQMACMIGEPIYRIERLLTLVNQRLEVIKSQRS